jgi:hypothetical protein
MHHMQLSSQGLGQDICHHLLSGNEAQLNVPRVYSLPHKVIAPFDVLGLIIGLQTCQNDWGKRL